MTTLAESLPLSETITPDDARGVASAVADAFRDETAVYPLGGGTSLDDGLPASRPGVGLSLARLDRVLDYPARDMTITVEAGLTMSRLAERLAGERQWLPIDVPRASTATVGGVVATAACGPRRFGWGTPRDYVIGISAVDGRGMAFKGGGRVVKNVAGYDFCKLLTGSMGTLGVITQLTLKVRPLPASSAFFVCELRSWDEAERLLAALGQSGSIPSAVEVLVGPAWQDHALLGMATAGTLARLAVGLEGTAAEVDWMIDRLAGEWRTLGVTATHSLEGDKAAALWTELGGFPAAAPAPLVARASVLPSRTVEFVRLLQAVDPEISIQAHAGNGIVIGRFSKFEAADVSRQLVGRLQPAAKLAGGQLVVLSSTLGGLTHQAVWGGAIASTPWMSKVKRQFDPKGLLNPGRFVYAE
jgi:glycolate oxidase FAD binding subunit